MKPLIKSKEQLYLSNKSIGIDFFKAYQKQDVNKMLKLCSSDCHIDFLPLGDQGKGNVHEVGKTIWSGLIESFPSINNTVNEVSMEDGSIKCEVTIRGRQEKDFAGLVSQGKEFEEDHIFIFKINDKKKVEDIQINWNHESFVKQLTV